MASERGSDNCGAAEIAAAAAAIGSAARRFNTQLLSLLSASPPRTAHAYPAPPQHLQQKWRRPTMLRRCSTRDRRAVDGDDELARSPPRRPRAAWTGPKGGRPFKLRASSASASARVCLAGGGRVPLLHSYTVAAAVARTAAVAYTTACCCSASRLHDHWASSVDSNEQPVTRAIGGAPRTAAPYGARQRANQLPGWRCCTVCSSTAARRPLGGALDASS